ncbi:MAG TPA: GtrA family protein [Egibacteraceae bacterium]|nr:GtrA family protein [Egibacteraceae bacterium]
MSSPTAPTSQSGREPLTARRALPRFALVGAIGVAVNESILHALHGLAGLPLVPASVIATESAILGNYLGNELFTFHLRRLHLGRLLRFNAVALGGLVLTVGTLWLLQHLTPWHYLVDNLVAIAVGSAWNFAANFRWTWGPAARLRGAARPGDEEAS